MVHTKQELHDEMVEDEIKERGLDVAPRIDIDHINKLMEATTLKFSVIEGTNTTLCHVLLDGFKLATGESSCISKENFCAEAGRSWAKYNAMENARKELWKLEGWRLKVSVSDELQEIMNGRD